MVTPSLRDERGSATIEMVLLVPAFMLLILLLIMGGRFALAQQSIQSAASEAARAASHERGADSEERGLEAAESFLSDEGVSCSTVDVSVDTSGKSTDPGVPDQFVDATVSCDVPLGDLALPGVGGSRSVSASASSPVDTYRER